MTLSNEAKPNEAAPRRVDPPEAAPDPRVLWAEERTLLAWIPTGVSMMGFGFVVARFGHHRAVVALVRGDPIKPDTRFSTGIAFSAALVGVVLVAVLLVALMR